MTFVKYKSYFLKAVCLFGNINFILQEGFKMKHIKTLNTKLLKNTVAKGGCGECQTSCQSACKTSCTVANQSCENK